MTVKELHDALESLISQGKENLIIVLEDPEDTTSPYLVDNLKIQKLSPTVATDVDVLVIRCSYYCVKLL